MALNVKHKKICFVISAFSTGGVNRVIANIANECIKRGLSIDVVALSSMPNESRQIFSNKTNLHSLGWPRTISFIPLWRFFRKNRKYDGIISAVEFVNLHTIIASKLAKAQASLIVTTHTDLTEERKQLKSQILNIVYALASRAYPLADYICAVSQGVAQSLSRELKLQESGIKVINNPIVDKNYTELKPEIPHNWYKEDIPVIVGCGRLTPQKNFVLLINAFAKLLKKQPARLILLGDGKQKKLLKQHIQALNIGCNVYLAGDVSNPLDYFYYSRMFVLSSMWEGFGNVIVEALSMGCPIISTNCPSGPSEILEDGKWGKLVKMNDEAALTKAMLSELQNKKEARTYLRNRADFFNIQDITNQYLSLLR